MYKVVWKAGENKWKMGADLIEEPLDLPSNEVKSWKTPTMDHQEIQLKRPSAKSYEVEAGEEAGRVVVQFDGGAAK